MATKKSLKTINDRRIARVDRRISWFERGIAQLARRWRVELLDLIAQEPSQEAAIATQRILSLQSQVQGQLNALGYQELAREYVMHFDDTRKAALDTLAAMRVPAKPLAPLAEMALQSVREVALTGLEQVGQRAVETIAQQILMSTIAGVRRVDMIEAIEGSLEGRFKQHALTYADTALVSYDRQVNGKIWEAAGIEKFLYRGPNDIKTREFCQAHVGKTYTREQIDTLDNGKGQPKPVWIYGGGWNCRHVWTPSV